MPPLRTEGAKTDSGAATHHPFPRAPLFGAVCAWILVLVLLLAGCGQPAEKSAHRPTMDIISLLGGPDAEGYARADRVREFVFPQDHGPHPEFRTEWWYFTGNLQDEGGRRYGFQLTFFRLGLSPQARERESAWATDQAYMAHFALTDVGGQTFCGFERFSRGAMGLAGAQGDPFRVWLETWQASGSPADSASGGADLPEGKTFPWQLQAEEGGSALDLTIEPLKGIVLQGDRGLSAKGTEAGNASHYYSITRMKASGTLTFDGKARRVSGTAWFDHEWSTSALGEDLVGWDWFALQLADGTDLMFYRLRQTDGSVAPYSEGTLVNPAGDALRLGGEDTTIEPLRTWRSPESGAEYPVEWRMHVRPVGKDFAVRAVMSGQEQNLSVRYWEGAVDVLDEKGTEPSGWGYVELTGYARP